MSIFSKIKEGLQKTRDAMMQSMQRVLNSFTKIDEELFEQLEETMIMGDMGVETSVEICDRCRALVKERGVTDPQEIMGLIEEVIGEMMGDDTALDLSTKPSVIMVIGVNGAGKTTTIGKLCHQFKQEGKKVLVAAADTFRAAAIDQLEVWTQRAGVDIVKHAEGSDPGAVVFDGISAAVARGCDVLIIDTAGRLHNKKNLMNELEKINRILTQKAEGCAIETLLVLDATTGQNAVSQAKLFSEVANITGIVLTKLDGTAKGGIVVSIKNELGIPVKLVGVGEKIEDLQTFDNSDFVRALFDRSQDEQIIGEEETPAEEPAVSDEAPAEEKKPWWQRSRKTQSDAGEQPAETAGEPAASDEAPAEEKKPWWQPDRQETADSAAEPVLPEENAAVTEASAAEPQSDAEAEMSGDLPAAEPVPAGVSVSVEVAESFAEPEPYAEPDPYGDSEQFDDFQPFADPSPVPPSAVTQAAGPMFIPISSQYGAITAQKPSSMKRSGPAVHTTGQINASAYTPQTPKPITFGAPAPEPSDQPLYAVKSDARPAAPRPAEPVGTGETIHPMQLPKSAEMPAVQSVIGESGRAETQKPKKKGWWPFGKKKEDDGE